MRRSFRVLICSALSVMTVSPSIAAEGPPNLVIIMADDLGYADLGCYVGRRVETPHLDAMARQGVRFTDFHSNGPVCSPTRAALLTGRYQQRSGVDEVVFADPERGLRETHGLRTTELTFAKLLRPAGYRTALIGKWHLGYAPRFNPVQYGFDAFRGYVSGNVDYHSHIDQAGFLDWWRGAIIDDEPGYTTHLITRHALEFIKANQDRPFCLYIAHEAAHSPYQGPDDPPVRGPDARPPISDPLEIQRAYQEMVRELDDGVGEVLASIRRLGLDRNTFVFFCSDNGANRNGDNGSLRGFKGSLWEGGHRVPAIAWWPGRIAPGSTDEPVMSMDLMPTMLDLAGVTPPEGHTIDGISLAALMTSGDPLPGRPLFWSYRDRSAVRLGPWKLIENEPSIAGDPREGTEPTSPVALFHLADDLAEQQNLASRHPGKVDELQAALEAWTQEVFADDPNSE